MPEERIDDSCIPIMSKCLSMIITVTKTMSHIQSAIKLWWKVVLIFRKLMLMMAIKLPNNPKLEIKGIATFFRKAMFSELRSVSEQLILNNSRLPLKIPFLFLSTLFSFTLKNPLLSCNPLAKLRIQLNLNKTNGIRRWFSMGSLRATVEFSISCLRN